VLAKLQASNRLEAILRAMAEPGILQGSADVTKRLQQSARAGGEK
jgi:hypothetical protein